MYYDYVPKEYEGNILKYKYAADDKSLIYKYVFSPVAEWSLKFTPTWIAPNTLTLMGFLCIFIPHIIFMINNGNDWDAPVPQWLIVITTILFFTYVVLSISIRTWITWMESKLVGQVFEIFIQGSSSPLGMLLDHQMDAMIVVLTSPNVSSTVQLHSTIYAHYLFACPAFFFYITTLQAYYTGKLELPIINAASEGVLSVGLFLAYSAYAGPASWLEPVSWLNDIPFVLSIELLFLLLTITNAPFMQELILIRFIKIYNANPKKFVEAIQNALFGVFLIMSVAFVILTSPSNVGATHLRQLAYISGFTFSQQVGIIQIYHVCEIPLPVIRKQGLIINGALVINTILHIFGISLIGEVVLLNILAVIATLLQIHFILNMCRQFRDVLNISVFTIRQKIEI